MKNVDEMHCLCLPQRTLKNFHLIENDGELYSFVSGLDNEGYIAVDTEFDRRTTYYPILSLVQITTSKKTAVIDAFLVDINILKNVFMNPSIIKIFHAGKQDIEILEYIFGEPMHNIFDTQIAASLVEMESNLGFSKLIKTFFDVELDKSLQKESWLNRPLTYEQIEYASKDTFYLFEVFPKIYNKLKDHKRLSWLQDIQRRLLAHSFFDFSDYWQKVKLSSSNAMVWFRLRKLWLWRENIAKKNNKHRLIFPDYILISLAQYKKKSELKIQKSFKKLYLMLTDLDVWDEFYAVYENSFLSCGNFDKDPVLHNEYQIVQ